MLFLDKRIVSTEISQNNISFYIIRQKNNQWLTAVKQLKLLHLDAPFTKDE